MKDFLLFLTAKAYSLQHTNSVTLSVFSYFYTCEVREFHLSGSILNSECELINLKNHFIERFSFVFSCKSLQFITYKFCRLECFFFYLYREIVLLISNKDNERGAYKSNMAASQNSVLPNHRCGMTTKNKKRLLITVSVV